MRIVWTNQFAQLPDAGGGTRHIELATELYENYGIRTTIIAANRNYLSGKRVFERDGCYKIGGVNFCVIDVAYRPGYVRRAYSWIEFAAKLWKKGDWFKEADIIIGSSPTLFGAYSTMKLAKKYHKPFVLEIRDLWPEILRDSGKLSDKSPVYLVMDRIARKLYRDAHYIVTLSLGQKEYIENFTERPMEVVYNGMSDKIVESLSDTKKFDGFNVVYAGALGYANDVDTIIKAAELLKNENNIRIHILGDGPYRKKIEGAIQKGLLNLIYHGLLPKKEAFRIMAGCQVGLLTLRDIDLFRYGVSPNKLFDYLSLGLYVVSTVKGEMEDILKRSGYGTTVEPANPQILSSTIKELYDRFTRKPEMFAGKTAREFVRNNYSREIMAKKLFKVLNGIYTTER